MPHPRGGGAFHTPLKDFHTNGKDEMRALRKRLRWKDERNQFGVRAEKRQKSCVMVPVLKRRTENRYEDLQESVKLQAKNSGGAPPWWRSEDEGTWSDCKLLKVIGRIAIKRRPLMGSRRRRPDNSCLTCWKLLKLDPFLSATRGEMSFVNSLKKKKESSCCLSLVSARGYGETKEK